MQVQILRPISGLDAEVGQVVDASAWPDNRVRQLLRQRRVNLVMVPAADVGKGRRHGVQATDAR